MSYLLDSNVFMQASNLHYGFDFCGGFWEWIDREHAKQKVFSIKKVRDEILNGNDELIAWAKPRASMFLDTTDGKTYDSLTILSAWASKNYKESAQSRFFSGADFDLVGFAHAHNHIVVTQERYQAESQQIKIPNACKAMGVDCMNTYDLLRKEKVKFVLE